MDNFRNQFPPNFNNNQIFDFNCLYPQINIYICPKLQYVNIIEVHKNCEFINSYDFLM